MNSVHFEDGANDNAANAREMFHELSQINRATLQSYRFLAISLIPACFKLLRFFEDIRGFNLIQQTLLQSYRDLFVVLMVAIALISLFSIAGNIFFGGLSLQFVTVNVAYGTLNRLVVSASAALFRELVELEPRLSSAFFGLFFVSLWLVILNLVLGIIVSGVAGAMEVAESSNAAETLYEVINKYVLMRSDDYRRQLSPQAEVTVTVRAAEYGRRPLAPWKVRLGLLNHAYRVQYSAVIALRDHAQNSPVLFRDQLRETLHFVPEHIRRRVFNGIMYASKSEAVAAEVEERSNLTEYRLQSLRDEAITLEKILNGSEKPNPDELAPKMDGGSSESSDSDADSRSLSFKSSLRRGSKRSEMGMRQSAASMGSLQRTRNFALGNRIAKKNFALI